MENNVSLFSKINEIRVELLGILNKSGKNDYSHYGYFQLSDFMPYILKACSEKGIYTKFWISKDKVEMPVVIKTESAATGIEITTKTENFIYIENAHLLLINLLDTNDREEYIKETANVSVSGAQPIQNAGGKSTYMKRYMYMDAFEITENDFVEENTGKPETKAVTKTTKPATKKAEAKLEEKVEYPVVEESKVEKSIDTSALMSIETKVHLATYMKDVGLNPQTTIIECANELGVDVPQLKESHKEKILEIVNKKVGK